MQGDVAVLLEQIDVEALALLLRSAEDQQGLARADALAGDSALVRHRLKKSALKYMLKPLWLSFGLSGLSLRLALIKPNAPVDLENSQLELSMTGRSA